jgi:hypothetical protein
MFTEERMKKDIKLLYGTDTMVPTRDGRSYMSIRPHQFQRKDSIKTSDSTSTDHSILSQDYQ